MSTLYNIFVLILLLKENEMNTSSTTELFMLDISVLSPHGALDITPS